MSENRDLQGVTMRVCSRLFSRLLLAVFVAALAGGQAPVKRLVVLLIGPPGAGKSTQAAFLKSKYGLPPISSEELIK